MYAMKHGYADLMDKSQDAALELSPTAAFESLNLQVYVAWASDWNSYVGNGILTQSTDTILRPMARPARKIDWFIEKNTTSFRLKHVQQWSQTLMRTKQLVPVVDFATG